MTYKSLKSESVFDGKELREILPQAYPFLMIDKVIAFEKGKSLTAVKNITANEWLFEHASDKPIVFPESFLIEAAAQAALILYHYSKKINQGQKYNYVLTKIVSDFFQSLFVGDQLVLKAKATKMMDQKGYMDIDISNKLEGKIATVEIMYFVQCE